MFFASAFERHIARLGCPRFSSGTSLDSCCSCSGAFRLWITAPPYPPVWRVIVRVDHAYPSPGNRRRVSCHRTSHHRPHHVVRSTGAKCSTRWGSTREPILASNADASVLFVQQRSSHQQQHRAGPTERTRTATDQFGPLIGSSRKQDGCDVCADADAAAAAIACAARDVSFSRLGSPDATYGGGGMLRATVGCSAGRGRVGAFGGRAVGSLLTRTVLVSV